MRNRLNLTNGKGANRHAKGYNKTQIHFISDIFTVVVFVVAQAPQFLQIFTRS